MLQPANGPSLALTETGPQLSNPTCCGCCTVSPGEHLEAEFSWFNPFNIPGLPEYPVSVVLRNTYSIPSHICFNVKARCGLGLTHRGGSQGKALQVAKRCGFLALVDLVIGNNAMDCSSHTGSRSMQWMVFSSYFLILLNRQCLLPV